MKKKLPVIIFSLFIILGLSIMLYPVVVNYVNSNQAVEVISDYSEGIASNTNNVNKEMLEAARLYNSKLSGINIVDIFNNPDVKTGDEEYLSILNVRDSGMMGYLQIPKIDVKIPIYHGTSDDVLQKGVGHVEGSSLPVGGETTHSVLSAHSGLPSARLFTDLNQLRNGDMFYIYVLDQVLAYKVDQVLVVEPSDVEALSLQEGKDYVTLVTCTPYAINTHRLLVRGTRVEYNPEVLENTPVEKELGKDQIILYLSLGLVIVILLFVLFFVIRSKKKTKKDTSITNNVISSEVINTSVDAVNTMNNVSEVPVNNNLIDASEAVNNREMVKTVASDDNVTFNNEVSVSDVSSEENTNDTNNTNDIDII